MLYDEFDELLAEIVSQFLVLSEDIVFRGNETQQGYLSEREINKRLQNNPNLPETTIYVFLWRVQRYFLVSFEDKSLPAHDSKDSTLIQIKQFIADWKSHAPFVQSFFYHNQNAINVLMLGLFLTGDRSVWDDCLATISASLEKTYPNELVFIHWCYEFFFLENYTACEALWHEFYQLKPDITALSCCLPFQLFKFIALCTWFKDNPAAFPYKVLPGLLIETQETTVYLNVLSLLLCSSSILVWTWKNNDKILLITQPLGLNFLSGFRLEPSLPPPDVYKRDSLQLLIGKLVFSYVSNLFVIQSKAQALGVFELWRCCLDRKGLYLSGLKEFVNFAHVLFSLGCYKEAYQIYYSLITSTIVKGDSKIIHAKLAMYSLAMFMESWLIHPENCTNKQLENIKRFSSHLADVPKYFKHDIDKYKVSISKLLHSIISFINTSDGKAFIKMGPIFIDEWFPFFSPEERNRFKKAIHPLKPKIVAKKLPPIVVITEVVVEAPLPVPKVAPKSVAPSSFFQEPRHIIHQKHLPIKLMLLVKNLQAKHPRALFYLTGGAVLDLLTSIPPNDYDLVMFGLTFDALKEALSEMEIKHKHIGQNHPIVMCKLDEVSIDFSCLPAIEEASAMECLKEDFPTRLFNVSALYVKLTPDNTLPIFSFSGALSSRNKKIITANSDPITLFQEKPWAIIRLVFVKMKYPKYTISHALNEAKSTINETWLSRFEDYDAYFSACFVKLLSRFPFKACNQRLQEFGLLNILTGLTLHESNLAIDLIKGDIPDENKYSYWLYALTLYAIKEKGITEPLPIARVLSLSKEDRKSLAFIHAQIPDYPFIATDDKAVKDWVTELFPNSPYCVV